MIAKFTIKRNDVYDIIRALKALVDRYDDPKNKAQYTALHLFANKDLMVDVQIERPMIKQLTKEDITRSMGI